MRGSTLTVAHPRGLGLRTRLRAAPSGGNDAPLIDLIRTRSERPEKACCDTNPNRAFKKFEEHVVEMVRSVLPIPAGTVLALKWTGTAGTLGFVRGSIPTSVPVDTKLGTLYLSLAQDVIAIREGTRFRLRTKRYAYKLLPTANPAAEAIIRWEFDSETDDRRECRNHVHLNASLPVGDGTLALGRTHLPTAWVLIEHVLRFLFHDMEVQPRTQDWPEILRASETTFYEEFTSKRYRFRG